MYGTRDAAQNWEYAYTEFLENCGFKACRMNPCIFYHEDRERRLVAHGNDFTKSGADEDLVWFRGVFRKAWT